MKIPLRYVVWNGYGATMVSSCNYQTYFILLLGLHFVLNGCVRQGTVTEIQNKNLELSKPGEPKVSQTMTQHQRAPLPADFEPVLKPKPVEVLQSFTAPEASLMSAFLSYFWPSKEEAAEATIMPLWQWPLKPMAQKAVLHGFTPQTQGINIGAPEGTPIYPLAPGTVLYVGGMLLDFGNLVVVAHGGGWTSVYAHLKGTQVTQGQQVGARTVLGGVGQTGIVKTPQLHLELRFNEQPLDPQLYLP